MLRKFGFPAVVFGAVLALAAPVAGLAKDRNDYGRDNGSYSYNQSYRGNDRAQYDEHAQEVWNVQRDVRERRSGQAYLIGHFGLLQTQLLPPRRQSGADDPVDFQISHARERIGIRGSRQSGKQICD